MRIEVGEDFVQELKAKGEEIKKEIIDIFSKNSSQIENIRIEIKEILEQRQKDLLNLESEFKSLKTAASKINAYQRIINQISEKTELTIEDFDNVLSGRNKSRIFKNAIAVQQYSQQGTQAKDLALINKAKTILYLTYTTIMSIRQQVGYNPILYQLFLIGEGESSTILAGQPSIEELYANSQIWTSSKNFQLVLQPTLNEINSLLNATNTLEKEFLSTKFENFIKDPNEEKVWQVVRNVKNKIDIARSQGKKVFYSYGQLLEVFVYLQHKSYIKTSDLYRALKQGVNTLSFEKGGDFKLKNMENELVDIQAKTISVVNGKVSPVRIMNFSNLKRVIGELIFIFSNSGNNLKEILQIYFSNKWSEYNSTEKIVSTGRKAANRNIKNIMDEIKFSNVTI